MDDSGTRFFIPSALCDYTSIMENAGSQKTHFVKLYYLGLK